jgi:thymidylate synthase
LWNTRTRSASNGCALTSRLARAQRSYGDARSYASRFLDYAGVGRDQLEWVTNRIRLDPLSCSATITTFEPLTDAAYIPCVSLLDFWIRGGSLELVVYAHSIDFGAKSYGNLLQLAELRSIVASRLGRAIGPLVCLSYRPARHVTSFMVVYRDRCNDRFTTDGP